jgi:hypothetical protein
MIDPRAGLRALMLADPNVNAAVGGNRIFPTLLPQGQVQPSAVYQRISGFGDLANTGPTGLDRPRFQIATWAAKADDASNLADLIRVAIDGFAGPVIYGSPPITIIFRGIFFDVERDGYDDIAKLYSTGRDYLVWFANR